MNWWRESVGLLANPEVCSSLSDGFLIGITLGLIVVLVVMVIAAVLRRRHRCRGIALAGEFGNLLVTPVAMREFVTRVLSGFREASLQGVAIYEKRGMIILNVEIAVLPDTAIPSLAERIRGRLVAEAAEKMGLETGLRVDVTVRSVQAREDKIARQHRKASPTRPEKLDDFEKDN